MSELKTFLEIKRLFGHLSEESQSAALADLAGIPPAQKYEPLADGLMPVAASISGGPWRVATPTNGHKKNGHAKGPASELLGYGEIAKALGLGRATAIDYLSKGRIPSRYVGGKRMATRADVDAYRAKVGK